MTAGVRPSALADDPLPWLTRRFAAQGCVDPKSNTLSATQESAGKVLAPWLDSLTSTIAGLSDNRTSYSARFVASMPTGGTEHQTRQVHIGSGVLMDPSLTFGQKCAVATGLVYHEAGHIRYHDGWSQYAFDVLGSDPRWADSGKRMANCALDLMGNAMLVDEMPGYAPTLEAGRRYFTDMTGGPRPESEAPAMGTLASRTVEVGNMLLYPWMRDYEALLPSEYVAQWREWHERVLKMRTKPQMVKLVREAMDMLEVPLPEPPPPAPESTEDEPGEGDEGESKPEDTTDEPTGMDESRSGDEGADEGDESEDASEPDEPDEDPESTDDAGASEGESEDEGAESGDDADSDGSEGEGDDESESDGDGSEDGDGDDLDGYGDSSTAGDRGGEAEGEAEDASDEVMDEAPDSADSETGDGAQGRWDTESDDTSGLAGDMDDSLTGGRRNDSVAEESVDAWERVKALRTKDRTYDVRGRRFAVTYVKGA